MLNKIKQLVLVILFACCLGLLSPALTYAGDPVCVCYHHNGECDFYQGTAAQTASSVACQRYCDNGQFQTCDNDPKTLCGNDDDCIGGVCEDHWDRQFEWVNGYRDGISEHLIDVVVDGEDRGAEGRVDDFLEENRNRDLIERVRQQCENSDKAALAAKAKKKGSDPTEPLKEFQKPSFFFKIPGLKLSDAVQSGPFAQVNFIGEYLVAAYNLMIGLSLIIAVVMIMIGGVRYILASSTGSVEGAKTMIRNSIVGMILILCVYLILYLVNPRLVLFEPLNLFIIERHIHDLPEIGSTDGQGGGGKKAKPCSKIIESKSWPEFANVIDKDLDKYACTPRKDEDIQFIVLHEGGRPSVGTKNILAARGLSTNFEVKLNGTVVQLVGPEKGSRHAGAINRYSIGIDLENPQECVGSGACANSLSCSSNCERPPAQVAALRTLMKKLSARFPIPYNSNHILAHCNISTNRADPRYLDFAKLGLPQVEYRDPANIINGKCVQKDWRKFLKKTSP